MDPHQVSDEMLKAGLDALNPYFDEDGRMGIIGLRDAVRDVYLAMQAAAREPLDIQPKGI